MRSSMTGGLAGGLVGALAMASGACRALAALLLALLTVLVVGGVAARNLADLGLPWVDELARFCGIALVYLTVPMLALRGQHVAVDMLPKALPPVPRLWLEKAAELAMLVFCALFLYALHLFLGRAGKFETPALGMSNWLFYAPPLVGFVLLALAALARLFGAVPDGAGAGAEDGEVR